MSNYSIFSSGCVDTGNSPCVQKDPCAPPQTQSKLPYVYIPPGQYQSQKIWTCGGVFTKAYYGCGPSFDFPITGNYSQYVPEPSNPYPVTPPSDPTGIPITVGGEEVGTLANAGATSNVYAVYPYVNVLGPQGATQVNNQLPYCDCIQGTYARDDYMVCYLQYCTEYEESSFSGAGGAVLLDPTKMALYAANGYMTDPLPGGTQQYQIIIPQ